MAQQNQQSGQKNFSQDVDTKENFSSSHEQRTSQKPQDSQWSGKQAPKTGIGGQTEGTRSEQSGSKMPE